MIQLMTHESKAWLYLSLWFVYIYVILAPVSRNVIPVSLVNLNTLNPPQVIVESSEGLLGRADCHIGECDLSDGQDLHSD